ncbi:AF4/FMR2 family member 1-like [Passer domesticus]|uniref:AF4/FMR2 family member 1-like n=1 Tax=Passer domesticus TaxID=48849 RepID=UPI0030FEDC8B
MDVKWKNNRDLLCIVEQERRRRQVAPEEKDPFLEKTPLFAKPYKTDKEDELSRRIKNLLGDEDSKVVEKPSSSVAPPRALQSQHKRVAAAQPSSSESGSTSECHSSSVSALPRAPAPEPMVHTAVQSIEGILKEMCSPLPPLLPSLQSPERTETSKFPVQAKIKKPSDVPSIEEIFREMSSSLPALLSHLQTPPRAGTSKLPLATKESHPDGSAAQKQKQAGTASETLLSSQPRALALQSQHKKVAAAQPSSSESGSTRECHSSSVCDREISCSDSEEDNLPRVLDLPVCEVNSGTMERLLPQPLAYCSAVS